jgi:hypothetical protein
MKIINLEGYNYPQIYMKYDVMMKIKKLVEEVGIEVGWICMVEKVDNAHIIYDVHVPKQKAHGATCEIDPSALLDIAHEISLSAPMELNNMRYWGHSHVNMDPSPSAQDEKQALEFFDGADYIIRHIINKKGEQTLALFDFQNKLKYDGLELEILYDDDMQKLVDKLNDLEKEKEEIAIKYVEEVKANISKIETKYNSKTNWADAYNSYYTNDYEMTYTEEDVIDLLTEDEIFNIASLTKIEAMDYIDEIMHCTPKEAKYIYEIAIDLVKRGVGLN